jgi:hypothetical protein
MVSDRCGEEDHLARNEETIFLLCMYGKAALVKRYSIHSNFAGTILVCPSADLFPAVDLTYVNTITDGRG